MRTESEGQQPLRTGGRDWRGRRQEGGLDCTERWIPHPGGHGALVRSCPVEPVEE